MEQIEIDNLKKQLALALIYLSAWKEKTLTWTSTGPGKHMTLTFWTN